MVFKENNPDFFEFKEEGDELQGVLIKVSEEVGQLKSMLYTLEVNGKPINVWGTTILDQRMTGTKPGDLIKIVYKGLGEQKPGKNAPKIFKVYIDKPEEEA